MRRSQLFALAITLLIFLSFSGCDILTDEPSESSSISQSSSSVSETSSSKPEQILDYHIDKAESSPNGSANRRIIKVTISESDAAGLNDETVTAFLKELCDKQLKAHKPDGLTIELYSESISTNVIAKLIYAPNAKWGDANYDTDGDYTGFEYDISIWLS